MSTVTSEFTTTAGTTTAGTTSGSRRMTAVAGPPAPVTGRYGRCRKA